MKCTNIYNARAQLLFSSLNLLFRYVLVAVVVVVYCSRVPVLYRDGYEDGLFVFVNY